MKNFKAYSEAQIKALDNHIADKFGVVDSVKTIEISDTFSIDVKIIKPTSRKNFYTLVSFGLGQLDMDVSKDMSRAPLKRAEIMLTLPADWFFDSASDDALQAFPFALITALVKLAVSGVWLKSGFGKSFDDVLSGINQHGVWLVRPFDMPLEFGICQFPKSFFAGEDAVNIYQIITLYDEELKYKSENTSDLLLRRFPDIFSHVFDNDRPNYCSKDEIERQKQSFYSTDEYGEQKPCAKKLFIPEHKIKKLLTVTEPYECFATDEITVKGKPIGYMYREEAESEFDSGWRFLTGYESDEYMANSGNIGAYPLNTVANFDNDIISHLEAPVGSAFVRDDNTDKFFEES